MEDFNALVDETMESQPEDGRGEDILPFFKQLMFEVGPGGGYIQHPTVQFWLHPYTPLLKESSPLQLGWEISYWVQLQSMNKLNPYAGGS